MLRSLPQTVWFNSFYLPLRQAVRLPILLYKPKLLTCGGSVVVVAREIKTGMEFNGRCSIGNNSFVSVGSSGYVVFDDGFVATSTFKLTSYYSIVFGHNVVFGWDCLVMGIDIYRFTKLSGGYTRGCGV